VSERTPPGGPPLERSREQICLLTGATGFIGGHLARRLARAGYPVRCLVRAGSDTSRLEELGVELALGDLTSSRSLARAVEGCHFVLHCGALVSDWAPTEEIAAVNVTGTRNVLEASVAASVARLIHFSSTDVYGYPAGAGIEESYAARRARNWYARTKLDAEREVRRVERTDALEVVILRPATVYGPGSADVIGEIARAIRAGRMLLIAGGRAIAGLCYVENLVDAAVLALGHEAAAGEALNVSDGLDVSWREFTDDLADGLGCPRARWSLPYWMAYAIGSSLEHGYRLLRRASGLQSPPLLSRQAVQVLGRNQDFSNRRLRERLGWEPRVDYPCGLRATLAWLEEGAPPG
jgi:nucleoside-diphosphate-sugar epimerase